MSVDTNFLPCLSSFDVQRAADLIQQAYAPPAASASSESIKQLQQELFLLQKRPEAWGLILPLLQHQDPNVQFFGAHTAQVKIARDWDSFPPDQVFALRDLLIQLTAHSMSVRSSKFILRKLSVALTSLALKLVPGSPSGWPDWILECVTTFSSSQVPSDDIHDFLAIVAEEVSTADLVGPSKMQVQQSLLNSIEMVVQAVRSSLESFSTVPSALRLLTSWMQIIPSSDITPLLPYLIHLLNFFPTQPEIFISASDTLQELMSKSALADGSGCRTLTEPLLIWLDFTGKHILEVTLSTGDVDEVSHSLCKLLVALGDHSASYLSLNIVSNTPVIVDPTPITLPSPSADSKSGSHTSHFQMGEIQSSVRDEGIAKKTKGQLVQTFLRLVLAYTGLPGYYGVEEEESEMTLGFWYLFQEALWNTDYSFSGDQAGDVEADLWQTDRSGQSVGETEEEQVAMAKAVYRELVGVLRRKVAFPARGHGWSKDQIEKFQVYRRDVGDTLINAYYVVRDEMLLYYVNDISQRLISRQESDGWQEIEATLHCITSIQEALDFSRTPPQLAKLFGREVLGRLPSTGHCRIRRTTLGFIGTYSSWFVNQPAVQSSDLLMSVLTYVASALTDAPLCLQAANALRNLCDANRKVLAPQIGAFAQLHAALGTIPDSEKAKIVQSIASVIQALPPKEAIQPIEAIVTPIIQKLHEALRSSSMLLDEARTLAIHQLETLSGVAKGLTRSTDGLLGFPDDEKSSEKMAEITRARADPRMMELRASVEKAVRASVELWSGDTTLGIAVSDLFKSITALPNDATLISLPPGPLLELVCIAARRQVTGVWLALAAIMVTQLKSPSPILSTGASMKIGPTPDAERTIMSALPILLDCTLGVLGAPGAMEANPDIVQEFFACMERTALDFTRSFYMLPSGALDALLSCAIAALAMQERYSLAAACLFLSVFIQRSSNSVDLVEQKQKLMQAHGKRIMKAVLEGFASIAPRSVVPNLIDLLGTLISHSGGKTGIGGGSSGSVAVLWMREILFAEDFIPSKATPEETDKFLRAVMQSRSIKRTKDAAQQFTLLARGLHGSAFGYASASM